MTLTLDLGILLKVTSHSLPRGTQFVKYELICTGEKIFCRQVKLNRHACRWTLDRPLPPPPPIPLKFIKERERERDQFNMKNNKLNFLKNRFPGMMINKL